MERITKARNALLRLSTERGFSAKTMLRMSDAVKGLEDSQKEKVSAIIMEMIQNCQTGEEAIRVLEEQGII